MNRVLGTPILLERQKPKKSGKKKKPRLKDADHIERHLTRVAARTAIAGDKGVRRYKKARKKSARRERDGAIVDLMPNVARGAAVSAGRMAPISIDLMRAGATPSVRRMTRRTARATARMINGS